MKLTDLCPETNQETVRVFEAFLIDLIGPLPNYIGDGRDADGDGANQISMFSFLTSTGGVQIGE